MNVKLIMKWDIKPGKDQEYFEFVVREWIPATNRLGLQMIAAWLTIYARSDSVPRIMAEGLADDMPAMQRILQSGDWEDIQTRLMDYVENYSQKVVYTDGNFQL